MYSAKATGLGFFPLIPLLITAGASIAGSAVSAKLAPKPATPDYGALAQAQEEQAKKNAIWIGAGAVLLIFVLGAMRR